VQPDISDKRVASIIRAIDGNNDGELDLMEFLNVVPPAVSLDDSKRQLLEAFRVFDINGDGYISKEELKQVMSKTGINITLKEAEQIIKEVDTNSDNKIDFEEFIVLMARNQQ
jgi:calmodulin